MWLTAVRAHERASTIPKLHRANMVAWGVRRGERGCMIVPSHGSKLAWQTMASLLAGVGSDTPHSLPEEGSPVTFSKNLPLKALGSPLAVRAAQLTPHSCCIAATHARDVRQLPPQDLLDAYTGQGHAECVLRFRKAPPFLASSLYLKKPERIMALLLGMAVWLLVYAALEYRSRQARTAHDATFPTQKGKPIQNPTTRWVFQYFVGIHLLRMPGQGAVVLNLTDEHHKLLRLLGKPYL
jgi:hypothetical protein